jgi:hypothetical protein
MNASSLAADARAFAECVKAHPTYATSGFIRRPLWPTARYYAGFAQIIIGAFERVVSSATIFTNGPSRPFAWLNRSEAG